MKREAGREFVRENTPIKIKPPVERQSPSQLIFEKEYRFLCDAGLLRDKLTDWRYQEQLNYEQNQDVISETVVDTLTTVIEMIENAKFLWDSGLFIKKGGTDGSQNDKFAR